MPAKFIIARDPIDEEEREVKVGNNVVLTNREQQQGNNENQSKVLVGDKDGETNDGGSKSVNVKEEHEGGGIEKLSWDNHKENIQPLTQGRKIEDLMRSLKIIDCNKARQKLLEERREEFDKNLKALDGSFDRQLDLWYDYIDWLEQNVPNSGKVNGITNAIEECIEFYYHKKEFKQDRRLFNIFMKFKQFCDEPIEIFSFMYANSICTLLAKFYLKWSWQYEIRKNMKRAEDLIKLGLKNLATPRELLLEALEQIKLRIDRMIRIGELTSNDGNNLTTISARESQKELNEGGIRAALQTLKFKVSKKKGIGSVPITRIGSNAVDSINVGGLKSQTKLVNGVPVAVTSKQQQQQQNKDSTSAQTQIKRANNKLVKVYNDNQDSENVKVEQNDAENDAENVNENNGGGLIRRMKISDKIPTSQRIQTLGRTGTENQIRSSGTLQQQQQQHRQGSLSAATTSAPLFKAPLSRRH